MRRNDYDTLRDDADTDRYDDDSGEDDSAWREQLPEAGGDA